MDMVRPLSASGSHGAAMLSVIADAAPAALGILLVFGFLGDLVAAAGIPITVTTLAAPSGHGALGAGTSNHRGNRQYNAGVIQRPLFDQERRSGRDIGEFQDDVIRLRRSDGSFVQIGSPLGCAYPGGCDPSAAEPDRDQGRQARSGPEVDALPDEHALGTRMRPIGGIRAVATTSKASGRETKNKKGDDGDDDDDDYDYDDDKDVKGPAKTFKIKKHKLKKWLLPLLVGYKLKFMTLVPLLFATLALLVASAGFAGFFFAMFTAALTLPKSHH